MNKISTSIILSAFIFGTFIFVQPVFALTLPSFTVRPSDSHYIIAPQLNTGVLNSLVKDFLFYSTATSTVLSGAASGSTNVDDLNYSTYTSASVQSSCVLHFEDGVENFVSSDTGIATVNSSSGAVTYVADGTVNITGEKNNRKKSVSCSLNETGGEYSQTISGFTTTSLAYDLSHGISALISGVVPSSTTYDIFSSKNDTTHTYTRNTNLYAHSIDLTAIPAASSSYGAKFNGVLVAPDILIQAHHMHSGGTIYFVDNSNNVTSRTVSGSTQISGTDIQVTKLSSDVAAGITPVKVLDANTFYSYITGDALGSSFDMPVIFTNQFRTLRIGRLVSDYSSLVYINGPSEEQFNQWYSKPISGDSAGSPALAVINGDPVLVGVWYTATSVGNVKNYISQINSAMASLGSSYSLSTVDLSGFPTY